MAETWGQGASWADVGPVAIPTSTIVVPIHAGQPFDILLADYLDIGDETFSFSSSPSADWVLLDPAVPDLSGTVPSDYAGPSVQVTVVFQSPSTGGIYAIIFILEPFNSQETVFANRTEMLSMALVDLLWTPDDAVISIDSVLDISWLTMNADEQTMSGMTPASGPDYYSIIVRATTELANRKRSAGKLVARGPQETYAVFVNLYINAQASASLATATASSNVVSRSQISGAATPGTVTTQASPLSIPSTTEQPPATQSSASPQPVTNSAASVPPVSTVTDQTSPSPRRSTFTASWGNTTVTQRDSTTANTNAPLPISQPSVSIETSLPVSALTTNSEPLPPSDTQSTSFPVSSIIRGNLQSTSSLQSSISISQAPGSLASQSPQVTISSNTSLPPSSPSQPNTIVSASTSKSGSSSPTTTAISQPLVSSSPQAVISLWTSTTDQSTSGSSLKSSGLALSSTEAVVSTINSRSSNTFPVPSPASSAQSTQAPTVSPRSSASNSATSSQLSSASSSEVHDNRVISTSTSSASSSKAPFSSTLASSSEVHDSLVISASTSYASSSKAPLSSTSASSSEIHDKFLISIHLLGLDHFIKSDFASISRVKVLWSKNIIWKYFTLYISFYHLDDDRSTKYDPVTIIDSFNFFQSPEFRNTRYSSRIDNKYDKSRCFSFDAL
ncbi:hypothetical protein N0V93_001868 [Gnomoniopsis smithogilvyi]|uniref:Uncharacterized protein n=1 Tax=Gnomoniopsis smithogilvyi TaxID=1191159 RepID=A0A9W8Z4I5_9PEZI|nr:hypothetical protein N0V93_001868 [Gnomoniopsis smithogilvyi]